ncbi:SHOCT domain-containing protein [Natronoarchaeum sp. GCM10025703]|uniref:SHOCT domain-containing protein n=1 Tax=unclassified Natronoarchaeum TaxID=2620183 RepID=UPI003613BC3B
MKDGPEERLRQNAVEVTSMLVTGLWLALLFVGPGNWWLGVMLFGYIVVVPIVALLYGDDDDIDEWLDDYDPVESTESDSEEVQDALETLRDRYARGELTDEQFERKLDRLLETETLEDVEDRQRRQERDIEFEQ